MSDHKLMDAVHGNSAVVRTKCLLIEDIAYSLDRLGLGKVAGELFAVSDALTRSEEHLSKAYGESLGEHLQQATEHSALLLKAALAGCFNSPERGERP